MKLVKQCTACSCLVAALLCVGCRKPPDDTAGAIRPVRAIKVGNFQAIEGREFPGRATAMAAVDLSFQVSGPLTSLAVDVGSEVKQGDVIASLDLRDFSVAVDSAEGNLARANANLLAMERGSRPEEIEQLKAAIEEAEATFRQATAEHDRSIKLIKQNAISQSEFDQTLARTERSAAEVKKTKEELNIGMSGARPEDLDAKRAEIKALEAAVANAKNQLDYAVLKAPFDGRVAARFVDNFQTVLANEPIVRLLDISKIEVTVQIPENLITLSPQVKKAICRFDAIPDREFTGTITKIGSEASQITRTYPVTVQLDQPADVQILPGMAATVRGQPPEKTSDDQSQQIIVPASALLAGQTADQSSVWVVDEASMKIERRAVVSGALTSAGMAISQGLEPGEWVVTAGVNSLQAGQEVKFLQEGNR